MTNAPEETEQDGQRSEVAEVEGTATGADAVPDKTSGTAPNGAGFDDDTERDDESGDTTIRDQRRDA